METIIAITVEPSFEGKQHFALKEIADSNGKKKYVLQIKQLPGGFSFPGNSKSSYELETSFVENLINELMISKISICPDRIYGLDGTMTEIKIYRGFNSVCYKWWGDLPKEWKNLNRILKVVNKYIKT